MRHHAFDADGGPLPGRHVLVAAPPSWQLQQWVDGGGGYWSWKARIAGGRWEAGRRRGRRQLPRGLWLAGTAGGLLSRTAALRSEIARRPSTKSSAAWFLQRALTAGDVRHGTAPTIEVRRGALLGRGLGLAPAAVHALHRCLSVSRAGGPTGAEAQAARVRQSASAPHNAVHLQPRPPPPSKDFPRRASMGSLPPSSCLHQLLANPFITIEIRAVYQHICLPRRACPQYGFHLRAPRRSASRFLSASNRSRRSSSSAYSEK